MTHNFEKNEKEEMTAPETSLGQGDANEQTPQKPAPGRHKISIKPAPWLKEQIEHSRRWREDPNYRWSQKKTDDEIV